MPQRLRKSCADFAKAARPQSPITRPMVFRKLSTLFLEPLMPPPRTSTTCGNFAYSARSSFQMPLLPRQQTMNRVAGLTERSCGMNSYPSLNRSSVKASSPVMPCV
jgi:hypothetical protein